MRDFGRNDFDDAINDFDERSAEEIYDEYLAKNAKQAEGYICYYADYVDVMRELSSAAKDVLTWFTFFSGMNTGRILLQSYVKEEMLRKLNITSVTFYRALGELKERDIVRGKNAKYYINPRYAYKGTTSARDGFMKVYPRF